MHIDNLKVMADSLQIKEQADVGITMPDGCRLSARIWMPHNADAHPVPAILEHLPYRKRDGTIHRDELTHPYFAARGYACIRVDMRGNGESQGLMADEYTEQELQDACNVIAWAIEQPWCSGSVGMMGISWGGFNSLQVAALQPPGLKAIISVCSTVDRFADDIHYKGGCLLTENIGWTANMLSYSSRPPDPLLVGDQWKSMWEERLQNMPFLASTWMRHQKRDEYWMHGSVCEDYSAIKAAVLTVGGWHDGYRNTINHLVENLSSPVKGIVGPWIHKYPHYAAPAPAIGFLQESLRWWDHWLKDKDSGVQDEPDYRVWLMDSVKPKRWHDKRPGTWIGEPTLPSPNIKHSIMHFRGNNELAVLGMENGDCELTISSTQDCGSTSGEYFPFAYGPELPDNQLADDKLSTCIDSAALKTSIDIVGSPALQLSLACDRPMGLIIVRLCDLRPDGTSALITSGMLNLMHRHSFENPTLLAVGKKFDTTLMLDQIAYRIPAGHQLRVALSTSYWPFVWPSPEQATLSLTRGSIELPVRAENQNTSVSFPPAETSEQWQVEELRPASSAREIITDDKTSQQVTVIHNDFGENRDLHHGLLSGSKVTERWTIHPSDPLSAHSDINWVQTGGREQWHWMTDVQMETHSDTDFFHIKARLRAYLDDELFFEREYADSIEREFI